MKHISILITIGILMLAAATTTSAQRVFLNIDNEFVVENGQVLVPITATNFTDIISIQGTFDFDESIISFDTVLCDNLPGLSIGSFGINGADTGTVTYSWFDGTLNGVSVPTGDTLFCLQFTAVGSVGQVSQVNFTGIPTIQEMVDNGFNTLFPMYNDGSVTITSAAGIAENASNIALNIYPNPSNGKFNFETDLKEKSDVRIKIYTSNEQLVYDDEWENQTGLFRETIDLRKFAAGTYYVQAKLGKNMVVRAINVAAD